MSEVLRYLGIGLETSPGTAVAADIHVDVASSGIDSPSNPLIAYPGGLGRAPRIHRPGPYVSQGPAEFAADVDTIGYALILAFGGDPVITGPVGDIYTYSMIPTLNRLMRTATFRAGKDLEEFVYPGAAVGGFKLTVEKGYAMITLDIVGGKDQINPAGMTALADLLLSDAYPMTFVDTSVSLASADRSAHIEKLELTYTNNPDAEASITMGSRFPRSIWQGDVGVELAMSIAFNDLTEKRKYWGATDATEPSADTIYDEEAIITLDSGATIGRLDLALPKMVYTEVGIQPSGRDRIVQSVKCAGQFDVTSGAAITATLETKQVITNAVLGAS